MDMSSPTHIPFSDAPERKSPLATVAPWLIAAVAIAVGAFLFVRVTEAPPVAEAQVTKSFAVQQPGADQTLVGIELTLKNVYDKDVIVRGIHAKLTTADGKEFIDQAAAAGDQANYFKAIPELKQSDAPPLAFDTKITPGQEIRGLIVLGFPVPKDAFDKRKSLAVTMDFYGMKPIVIQP
jgi:uncharacterized protein DUF4352